jgi:hypothetical protein
MCGCRAGLPFKERLAPNAFPAGKGCAGGANGSANSAVPGRETAIEDEKTPPNV